MIVLGFTSPHHLNKLPSERVQANNTEKKRIPCRKESAHVDDTEKSKTGEKEKQGSKPVYIEITCTEFKMSQIHVFPQSSKDGRASRGPVLSHRLSSEASS